MQQVSPSNKTNSIGQQWQVFIDFKMPCEGRIAAWRLFSEKAGSFFITVLEHLGACRMKKIGINYIEVPSKGYHVSKVQLISK